MILFYCSQVIMQTECYIIANYSKYFNENRILTLGNVSKGLQVNPHYFGNIIDL